jgi:hypothetical protein
MRRALPPVPAAYLPGWRCLIARRRGRRRGQPRDPSGCPPPPAPRFAVGARVYGVASSQIRRKCLWPRMNNSAGDMTGGALCRPCLLSLAQQVSQPCRLSLNTGRCFPDRTRRRVWHFEDGIWTRFSWKTSRRDGHVQSEIAAAISAAMRGHHVRDSGAPEAASCKALRCAPTARCARGSRRAIAGASRDDRRRPRGLDDAACRARHLWHLRDGRTERKRGTSDGCCRAMMIVPIVGTAVAPIVVKRWPTPNHPPSGESRRIQRGARDADGWTRPSTKREPGAGAWQRLHRPERCSPRLKSPAQAVRSLRRTAITRDRAVAGAWAYVIPALMDQGRQPGMSRCSRKGSAVSWCQTTSQLLPGDLSNNVARNGIAAGPTKRAAIATSRESCAIRWATGTCIKCRATARPRSSVECWSSVATFAASDWSRTFGTISKPFVMRKYEFNEGAVAMRNVRSSPSNPFKCIGAQPRHAKKGASQALRPRTAALFWIRFSVHYRH